MMVILRRYKMDIQQLDEAENKIRRQIESMSVNRFARSVHAPEVGGSSGCGGRIIQIRSGEFVASARVAVADYSNALP